MGIGMRGIVEPSVLPVSIRFYPCEICLEGLMMMIAFITIKSSLVPLIEGLCAQI